MAESLLAIVLMALLPLALQSPVPTPIRLGPTGDRLTADDLAQIGRLDFGGRAVWVLVGHPHGLILSKSWYVNAYLEPDYVAARVRRGRIAVLRAEMTGPDAYDGPKTWELTSMNDYGQVPVSMERSDAITGGRDLNRPFAVVGRFDDELLVAIVTLIRSGPSITLPPGQRTRPTPAGIFRTVEKSWPIAFMRRQADAVVEVSLLDPSPHEKSGQTVMLRKYGTDWAVVDLTAWIAD